jgi:hypothetical protein
LLALESSTRKNLDRRFSQEEEVGENAESDQTEFEPMTDEGEGEGEGEGDEGEEDNA